MNIRAILEEFPKLRALVVGDVCLDRWCRYAPSLAEPSRETGIPRTAVISTVTTPGAAGTIANNLVALGIGSTSILGVVGRDGFGHELEQAMAARGIDAGLLVRTAERATFTYTKLINDQTNVEDLARVDFINPIDMPEAVDAAVIEKFEESAPFFDVILVSDQAETPRGGVVTPKVRDAICRYASNHADQVIWVDSRARSEMFRGVIVKPNQDEAEAASKRALGRVDFTALREHIQAELLVVTLGDHGALIVTTQGEKRVPGIQVTPVDICGAGDSFTAGAAPALFVSKSAETAVHLGNIVASITVQKPGTGTASPAEVLRVAGEA